MRPTLSRRRVAGSGLLLAGTVFCLALGARGVHLAGSAHLPPGGDAVEYEELGFQIAAGPAYQSPSGGAPALVGPPGTPTAFRTPGLPGFIALVYLLSGRQPLAARGALLVLNAAAAAVLFWLTRRLYGTRPAVIAGCAWAVWPESVGSYYASDFLYAESLAVPLLVFAYGLSAVRGRGAAFAAGLLLGWAQLTRAYLLPLSVFAIALALLRGDRAARLRVLGVCLVAALPTLAWTARNAAVFGTPLVSTQAGIALWFGNNGNARGSWNGHWQTSPEMRALLQQHPELTSAAEPRKSALFAAAALRDRRQGGLSSLLWLESRKLLLFLWPFEMGVGFLWSVAVLLALVPWGAVLALRPPATPSLCLLVGTILSTLATVLVTFHDTRYRFCAAPAMIVLAALAVASLARGRGVSSAGGTN